MLLLISGIITRIFSSSFMGVFQKLLINNGEKRSIVNFYTYLGLTLFGFLFCTHPHFEVSLIKYIIIMGFLGALGNYYIIKAISLGEISSLAPINSFKPVVAMVFGIFLLKEIPGIKEIIGIIFIIIGTFILNRKCSILNKAGFYRFLALIFSGTEALFIKKIILLSDIQSAFFYWAASGLLFSALFAIKHPYKISKPNIKTQLLLIISAALMQYSTNYVFEKMNVSYALALFQLSTIFSVFLGVNLFREKGLCIKLTASLIMIFGAAVILL